MQNLKIASSFSTKILILLLGILTIKCGYQLINLYAVEQNLFDQLKITQIALEKSKKRIDPLTMIKQVNLTHAHITQQKKTIKIEWLSNDGQSLIEDANQMFSKFSISSFQLSALQDLTYQQTIIISK